MMEQLDLIGNVQKITPTDKLQTCPCCDQTVKLYKRAINKGMVTDLAELYKIASDGRYVHISEFTSPRSSREIGTLKMWNLVERMPATNNAKRTSGMYRITSLGMQFVRADVKVHKYALMYNSKCFGLEGDMVGIQDCIEGFNYFDLMAR